MVFAGSVVLWQGTQKLCGTMVLGPAVTEEIAIKKNFPRRGVWMSEKIRVKYAKLPLIFDMDRPQATSQSQLLT